MSKRDHPPTAKVDGQPSTENADDDKIIPTSIEDAGRSPPMLEGDPANRWIETVLASVQGRSHEERQALADALLNGESKTTSASLVSGLEPNRGESEGKTTPTRTHPVSGTSTLQTTALQGFSPRSGENCVTQPCHSVASDSALKVWNHRGTSVSDCVTRV